MAKIIIRCQECDKDITHKVQVYWKGKVLCEDCNLKEK